MRAARVAVLAALAAVALGAAALLLDARAGSPTAAGAALATTTFATALADGDAADCPSISPHAVDGIRRGLALAAGSNCAAVVAAAGRVGWLDDLAGARVDSVAVAGDHATVRLRPSDAEPIAFGTVFAGGRWIVDGGPWDESTG